MRISILAAMLIALAMAILVAQPVIALQQRLTDSLGEAIRNEEE